MNELNSAIRDTKTYIDLPLLLEHWYVAGLTEEFGRDLLGRTLLEKSIVFYRTEAGELIALQNRCLHRSFPLSESKLVGDNIVCGYHGIEYSPQGDIKNVPCQTQCPKGKLRKYPTKELGPCSKDHDDSSASMDSINPVSVLNFPFPVSLPTGSSTLIPETSQPRKDRDSVLPSNEWSRNSASLG